jgi:hypothetical protein
MRSVNYHQIPFSRKGFCDLNVWNHKWLWPRFEFISIEVKSGDVIIFSISIYLRHVMNVRNAVPVDLEENQCVANEKKINWITVNETEKTVLRMNEAEKWSVVNKHKSVHHHWVTHSFHSIAVSQQFLIQDSNEMCSYCRRMGWMAADDLGSLNNLFHWEMLLRSQRIGRVAFLLGRSHRTKVICTVSENSPPKQNDRTIMPFHKTNNAVICVILLRNSESKITWAYPSDVVSFNYNRLKYNVSIDLISLPVYCIRMAFIMSQPSRNIKSWGTAVYPERKP